MSVRDRKVLGLLVALSFVGSGCLARPTPTPTPVPSTCALQGRPELIAQDDVAIHQLWELPDASVWWSDTPPDSAALRHYQQGARARVQDVEPYAVLQRQRAVHEAATKSASMHREAANMRLVMEDKIGRIARASCLELLLFAAQAERFPMLEQPTEFGAFVLRRGTGPAARVRVYYSGLSRLGGRISREVTARVSADAQQGWEVVAHLHNHSFLFDRQVGDKMWTTQDTKDDIGGGLSPSLTDVQFYRSSHEETKLRGAWVTNGFDTVHFTWPELDLLQAAGSQN